MNKIELDEDYQKTLVILLYEQVMSRINKFKDDLEEYGGVHIGYTREFFDDIAKITQNTIKEEKDERTN
tara:strand:+ start:6565 stop:6771 length:207 start_codon:yes stop_codon:yes gene_type:complete